jgi:hypothetical protein
MASSQVLAGNEDAFRGVAGARLFGARSPGAILRRRGQRWPRGTGRRVVGGSSAAPASRPYPRRGYKSCPVASPPVQEATSAPSPEARAQRLSARDGARPHSSPDRSALRLATGASGSIGRAPRLGRIALSRLRRVGLCSGHRRRSPPAGMFSVDFHHPMAEISCRSFWSPAGGGYWTNLMAPSIVTPISSMISCTQVLPVSW